jgi:cytochrome c556
MNKPLCFLRPSFLLISTLIPLGCSWTSAPREDVPAMHRNFSRSIDIQTGIVQGDVQKAQAAAEWLMAPENRGSFSGDALAREGAMLAHASTIAGASDPSVLASEAGNLAASCGKCHQAMGGGPRFVLGSQAPGGTSQEAHMIRHLWAVDRLWEGLEGPSDEAWLAGAQALAQTDPSIAEDIRANIPEDALDGFLAAVSNVAVSAASAESQDQRATAYGQVMASCQSCHSALGAPTSVSSPAHGTTDRR